MRLKQKIIPSYPTAWMKWQKSPLVQPVGPWYSLQGTILKFFGFIILGWEGTCC